MRAQERLNWLREAFDEGDWVPCAGGWLSPEPVPLQEVIDAFLSDKEHLRPRTQDTAPGILWHFQEQMPPRSMLQDVEPDDVKQCVRDLELSSASQHKRFHPRRAPSTGPWRTRSRSGLRGPCLSGPVLTDRDDESIRPGRTPTRFTDMARKADLDERIHFHSLRHTTGSWLSMRGVPMRHIQAILGPSDRNVTEKYSHLAPETLDWAMEETFGRDDGGSR